MKKLTGEQTKILYLPDEKNLVILGAAGSGKSLVALYKSVYLAIKYPSKKIGIVCFNKPIIEQIKTQHLPQLCQSLQIQVPRNISVTTYHSLVWNTLRKLNSGNEIKCLDFIKVDEKEKCINDSIKKLAEIEKYTDSRILNREIDFFKEEISWLQGMMVKTEEEYQELERTGRGRKNPVNKGEERKLVYRIFKGYKYYRSQLNPPKYFDYDDISWKLEERKERIPDKDKFDFLIIDEFQDMDKAKIQSLTYLTKANGACILLGDYAQQILGTKISFKQLGVNNISKETFVKNYRNTKQISNLANILIEKGFITEEEDEKISRVSSRRDGEIPQLQQANSFEVYKNIISNFFTNKIGSNGIILMDPTSFKTIAKILKVLDLDNHVELYTINQVKGLEFDNVLVLDIDKSKYIEDYSNLEDNENNEVAKQLYVAITRATTNLALTYQNYDMNFYLGG